MKHSFLFILFILSTSVFAQKLGIHIQESKVYKMTTARVQNDYILPDNQGGFITISSKRSGFLANPLVFESYLTQYDKDLNRVKSKTIRLNKGIIKGHIKGAFVQNDKLYLINLVTNLRKRYYAFNKIEGDIKQGTIKETEFLRLDFIYPKNEVNLFVNPGSLYYQKLKYYSDVNFFNPKIFIKFSRDRHYFAIIYRDLNATSTLYHIKVFDHNFNPVYSQQLSENVPASQFYINDLTLDDQTGAVYIAGQLYKSDPLRKRRLMNTDNTRQFKIYYATADKMEVYNLKPRKVFDKIHLKLGQNLIVYGFFRHRYLDLNHIDGFYRLDLTPELALLKSTYQTFEHQLVNITKRKSIKKSKNHAMVIRKTFLLEDGSLVVNAEDLFVPLMMKKEDREATVREIVGNLFSIKVAENGQIIWAKKINKRQVVKPRLALHSVFAAWLHQANYILYTDSPLNMQDSNQPFYLSGKDLNNLNGIKISSGGQVQKQVLYEPKRSKFRFMPIEGTLIDDHTAIIPAKDHMFIKFYKLTFD